MFLGLQQIVLGLPRLDQFVVAKRDSGLAVASSIRAIGGEVDVLTMSQPADKAALLPSPILCLTRVPCILDLLQPVRSPTHHRYTWH